MTAGDVPLRDGVGKLRAEFYPGKNVTAKSCFG